MINLLHTWQPPNIIFSFGPFTFYWYGLIIGIAIILGYLLILKLANYFNLKKKDLNDLAFYLIIVGIIGARIYEVFLEWPYYYKNPINILKVWEGGLAIHGVILFGLIFVYFFARYRKINFWKLIGAICPGLVLGQAIGRFGNWFNQELFGLPTNLPWSIPIDIQNRPIEFVNYQYFHPTFLYESLGNIIILIILLIIIFKLKNNFNKIILGKIVLGTYLFLYSTLRFLIEFIRLDPTPSLIGLRWPQLFSIFLIIISLFLISQAICNYFQLTKKNS